MNAIINFALEHWPLAVLLLAFGWALWQVFKFYNSVSGTQDSVTKLETTVQSHSDKIDSFQKTVDKLDYVCDQLTEVIKWIVKMDPQAIDTLAPKHSPRRLSTVGMMLYQECGAEKALNENKDFLLAELKKKDPKTAYDVEEGSFDVLLENLSNKMFNEVKNYIYNEPEMKELTGPDQETVTVKLSIFLILRLMAIVLRDEYLKVNPMETSEE